MLYFFHKRKKKKRILSFIFQFIFKRKILVGIILYLNYILLQPIAKCISCLSQVSESLQTRFARNLVVISGLHVLQLSYAAMNLY